MINPSVDSENQTVNFAALFAQRSETFERWNTQIQQEKNEIADKLALKIFTELKNLIIESTRSPVLRLYTPKYPLQKTYSFNIASKSFGPLFEGCLPENSLIAEWQGEIKKNTAEKMEEDKGLEYSETSFSSYRYRMSPVAYFQMNDRICLIAKQVQEKLTQHFVNLNEEQEASCKIQFSANWVDSSSSSLALASYSSSNLNALSITLHFGLEDEKFDTTTWFGSSENILTKIFKGLYGTSNQS